MLDDREKNGQVSDAELDALLAKWAEAEMEPPARFHEQTMARLRAEVQAEQSHKKVVSIFSKKKQWMSIAAAAVLVLCCIPVVQAQFGSNMTNPAYEIAESRKAEGADSVASVRITEQEKLSAESVAEDASDEKTMAQNLPNQNKTRNTDSNTTDDANAAAGTPNVEQSQADISFAQSENDTDEAAYHEDSQASSDGSQAPAVAMFRLDGPESAAVQGRMIEETAEERQAKAQSYQQALEKLRKQLQEAEELLEEYEKKFQAEPDNTELPDQMEELRDNMNTLQKEIKELEALVAKTSTQQ